MKEVQILSAARKQIRSWTIEIKKEVGVVLMRLQSGDNIGMPDIRRMPSVARGVAEIRIQANDGAYRTFFVLTSKFGVVVFHAFKKNTQKTPQKEIETGRKRLKEMLTELED